MKKLDSHLKLIIAWIIISIWGALFIYSASYRINVSVGLSPYASLINHLVIMIAMFILLIIITRPKIKTKFYNLLRRTSRMQFFFVLISLVLVLVLKTIAISFGISGLSRGGAYQVIPIGPVDFQPLEFYKITVILYFAHMLGRDMKKNSLKRINRVIFTALIGVGLIALQPDLGGSIIIVGEVVALIIINNEYLSKYLKIIVPIIIVAVVGLFGALLLGNQTSLEETNITSDTTQDYRAARLEAYIDPFSDLQGSGQNIVNSALAISNGGITGSGYLQSVQSSGYLFASHTDFIFAVICEDLGIIGAAITILLLLSISFFSIQVATESQTKYGEIFCYGYAFLIIIQSFINIGGVTGAIPMTGVTLPFISSGMNSYVFLSLGLFYVVLIGMENKRKRVDYEKRAASLFM